jgi:iron complex outermembrane receptor protein
MPTQITTFALRPTVLAAAIALHGVSALAQTAPTTANAATDTGITLSTVTVSADASAEGLPKPFAGGQVARGARIGVLGNQDTMETPFSFTAYTHDLILDQQARSIGDVLQNDPGVRLTRGYGNFQQAYIIRGFPVYSDDVTYNGLYGLVPRQYTASEFIERVEVFRGANTFLSGGGSGGAAAAGGGVGGLINVVPKRAPNEPLNRITFGVESGGQLSVGADIARRFGPDQSSGVRLNVARRDGDLAVDGENQKLNVAGIGLDWRSRNVRLSADAGFQENYGTAIRPSVYSPAAATTPIAAAPDASRNFAQPWTFGNSRDAFGTLRGEWDINDRITAWAAIGARHGEEQNSLANPTLTSAAGDTSTYRFDNHRKEVALTGEVGARASFSTGSVGHTVTVAANGYGLKERNGSAFSNFAGFAGNLYSPVSVPPPPANFFANGSMTAPTTINETQTASLAVSDTLSFLQDTLLLTLGARHQKMDTTDYDPNSGAVTAAYSQSRTSPVGGVVFKLNRDVSVYGNYIEGLIKGATITPLGGTPTNLKPYAARQTEIGAKYEAGTLGASVSYFTIRKSSAFLAFGNVPGEYGQESRGLEFNVYGEAARGLRLLGGLTLLDAKQVNSQVAANNGKNIVGVPDYQLNLGADWDVPGVRGLAVDGRVIRTGKQYANASNTQSIPAWTRFDLGARYLIEAGGKPVTLRARVENLFDKSYWASAGGYPGQSYLVLGQPRTFVLSASIDF